MERENDFLNNTSANEPVDDFWAGFEAAKKAAEEEAAKIAEEKALKAAEEAAARQEVEKKTAEEAARVAALETAKKAAEEAKILAEKAAEEAEAAKLAAEETKRKTAEEVAKRAAEEEARKAAEEAAKKAAEEEAKRTAEEAAKKAAAEEEAAKKAAAAEAKKAAKRAEAEAKAVAKEKKEAKKKAAAEAKKSKNVKVSADNKGNNPNPGLNIKALIIAAVCCLVVLVGVFFGSKMIFGGVGSESGTASEEAAKVEQEITAALQAANVGLSFSVSEERLSIANQDGYVVFFKDQYTLYKATGTYSKSGLSNNEMISQAKTAKVSVDNAEMISSCVTSYFINTRDIANKSVTLNVRITDNEAGEQIVNKLVAVNVASSTAAVIEGETTE